MDRGIDAWERVDCITEPGFDGVRCMVIWGTISGRVALRSPLCIDGGLLVLFTDGVLTEGGSLRTEAAFTEGVIETSSGLFIFCCGRWSAIMEPDPASERFDGVFRKASD